MDPIMKRIFTCLATLLFLTEVLSGCSKPNESMSNTTSSDTISTTELTTTTTTTTTTSTTTAETTKATTTTKKKASTTAPTIKVPVITVPTQMTSSTAPVSSTTSVTNANQGKVVNGLYTATDNSYTISVPEGWTFNQNGIAPQFFSPDCEETGTNMNILASTTDGTSINDITKDQFELQLSAVFDGLSIQAFNKLTINNLNALEIIYAFTISDVSGLEDMDFTICQYIIETPTFTYTISYVSLNPSDSLMQSFRINAQTFHKL